MCFGHTLMLPDRFRWVYCQLDVLRQCFPSSVRGVLAELPESLDETYERILRQIPKPNQVHAHRLLQCLLVAASPLTVKELAEVLAIDSSATGMTPMIDENLRWEDKEQALLFACSSLITIAQGHGGDSRLVQFSHFSVKEFLTSDRLGASTVDTLRYHHIRLEAAHVMMAQMCLSVLLQLEDHMDKQTIRNYPLSYYAGKHFVDHAGFENVISSISDEVDDLFDRDKPHFYTWVWLQIGDWNSEGWYNSRMGSKRKNPPNSFRAPDHDTKPKHPPCSLRTLDRTPDHDTKPKHPPRLPPLYYVAALGYLCLTRHLILKCSQDIDVRDDKGCTPLHIALLAGKEGVSQLLIEHSVDLDIRAVNYQTPLHIAASMGLAKATRMLLERGEPLKAGLNAMDENRRTPLQLASRNGHSRIARLLLEFGADVDTWADWMTPLLFLSQCRWGNHSRLNETAQVLLEYGASVHVRNVKKNRQTSLHTASYEGLSGIVASLLEFGADVDAQDDNTMTPLLLLLESRPGDDTKIAQLLLEHGASVHVRNKDGQMPLHLASHHGLLDIVALLLKFGAVVDAQDNDTMTPLQLVLQVRPDFFGDNSQITKTAQLLLEHGASVHVRNKNGWMPLHTASCHGDSDFVALLLKFGAEVDAQDNDAMTPLLLLSHSNWSGNTETVQLLLEHGANVQARNKNGQMPLHIASQCGLSDLVALLLKFGAGVDAQDNDAMTPLHSLSQRPVWDDSQLTKTAKLLLENGASVDVRNKSGQTPLHLASHQGLSGTVALLLKFGADVNAQDNDTMTPLHLVLESRRGNDAKITNFSQLLLEHGASVHVGNKSGQMPLHLASHYGLLGVVALLLKFGADVDAQDNDTMTALLFVLHSRRGDDSQITKTAQLLLEHGASVHVRNKNGQMPLHLASHHGLFDSVALLLKFGADVDAQDNDTMTPLLLVSQSQPFGREYPKITKTVRLLLDHGASVDVRNKTGQTPLHLATHYGLSGVAALLLKFGADVDTQDNDTMTPLLFVSQNPWGDNYQNTKSAQLLLEHGASVHVRNKNGQMPLHLASQHVLTGIVEILLNLGADVNAQDNSNITPLHFAVSSPFQRGLSKSLLLDDDSPPLWSVIKTIKLLLGNGANLQMQNDKGETPFQVTLRRGEHVILDVLSDYKMIR